MKGTGSCIQDGDPSWAVGHCWGDFEGAGFKAGGEREVERGKVLWKTSEQGKPEGQKGSSGFFQQDMGGEGCRKAETNVEKQNI